MDPEFARAIVGRSGPQARPRVPCPLATRRREEPALREEGEQFLDFLGAGASAVFADLEGFGVLDGAALLGAVGFDQGAAELVGGAGQAGQIPRDEAIRVWSSVTDQ